MRKESNHWRKLRWVAVTMALVLVTTLSLLPAAAEEGDPESYGLWVGGVKVTPDKLSDTGWIFDAKTNTLTLDGYTNVGAKDGYYSVAGTQAALYYAGTKDLEIVLKGTNTLALPSAIEGNEPEISVGVSIEGKDRQGPALKISGDGTLNVNAGKATKESCGIYCYKGFAFTDGTVNATGGKAEKSYGVYCQEDITVSGGALNAVGGSADKSSYGLYSYDGYDRSGEVVVPGVLVSGGKLNATGGEAPKSYGLTAELSQIDITSGELTATGGKAEMVSYGVDSGIYTVRTEGGKITATGGTVTGKDGRSCGIYSGVAPMYFNGNADVTFIGGDVENGTSYGIRSTHITFNGATVNAAGGKGLNSYGIYGAFGTSMKAGTVTVAGGSASQCSCGIYTDEEVSVIGGALNVVGGSVSGKDAISSGIYFDYREMNDGTLRCGSLSVNGGTLNAIGGTAAGENSNSFGIFTERASDESKITVGGGTVTAVGGDVSGVGDLWSGGIDAQNLIVSGGNVAGIGGNITEQTGTDPNGHFFQSHGIYAWEKMTLSGGTVSGTGGTISGESRLPMSSGVYAMLLKMNDGELTGTGSDVGVNCMVLQADKGVITGKGTDTAGSNTGIFAGNVDLGADVILIGEAAAGTKYSGISISSGPNHPDVPSVFDEALSAFVGESKDKATPKTIDEFLKLNDEEDSVSRYVRIAAKPYSVTFDANDGVFRDGRTTCVVNGAAEDKIASIAPASKPTQEKKAFAGWALDSAGNKPVGETAVQGDQIVYAVWKNADITVTLDANGGAFDNGSSTKQVGAANGTKAAELTADAPRPADWEDSMVSYSFKFWSLTANGEQVDENQVITGDIILYAIWNEEFIFDDDDPDDPGQGGGETAKYEPTISDSENGKVSVDPKAPAKGDTVTVTAFPDEGYTLGSLTVKDAKGNEVPVTKNADGTYSFTQPSGKVTITPVFEAIQKRPFVDVKDGDWFYDAVYHCFDNGYFKGTDETHFTPGGTMTRAMFATVLYRLADEPEVTGESKFSDVPAGQWYTNGVIWASEKGIIEGYGNGKFGTNDPVTREQMVTLFWRYSGKPAADSASLSAFTDADKISPWAKDAFAWAVSEKIINGKGGGVLDPKGTGTRAEVAQIVTNYDKVKGE